MIKILAFAGGLCGAVTLSQYPEFAQQYTQRLAGQVDALTQVVEDFDTSALEAGLTRTQALDEMTGTAFLDARAADMRRTFSRHAMLEAALTDLRSATPLSRVLMPHRLSDRETFVHTWDDFVLAVPVSVAGAASASVGFAGGWLGIFAMLWLLKLPFAHRSTAEQQRRDPPVRPIAQPVQGRTPRLMGETRP
ncbi:DUF2937 family protein [Yoonia sp. 208BN28-4]|uniref:DUF2937 family protein n=1 Tax=Yoonia sp. 208BN28-4 TaxID=3126505 RepID=UPI00309A160F